MQVTQQAATAQEIIRHSGRWVTERTYAQIHSLTKATLANWRWRDRIAQRPGAAPGMPQYRRFGRAVRYWLPADLLGDPYPTVGQPVGRGASDSGAAA